MAWTAPKTWTAEPLTVADMNLHIRDNLLALRDLSRYVYQGSTNLTTTSGSYTFIDITNLNADISIDVDSGKIEVEFIGTVTCNVAAILYLQLYHDGVAIMSSTVSIEAANRYREVAIRKSLGSLDAGTHTFDVRWYTSSGMATLLGGHYNFAIREVL